MSTLLSSSRPRSTAWGRRGAAIGEGARDLAIVVGVGLAAALAGYELAQGNKPAAAALCVLPLLVLGVSYPVSLLVPLAATIPWIDAAPWIPGGFQVTASDMLLLLITIGVLLKGLPSGSVPAIGALRPVAPMVLFYSIIMVVLLGAHWSSGGVAQTIQRYELYLFPLVVGAFAVLSGKWVPMLQLYVISATALAVIWPLHPDLGQKNPVGQMLGNAILILLIDQRAIRRLLPLLVILLPGLIYTQSRGALVSTVIGALVIMLMQGVSMRTIFRRAVPFFAVLGVAFALAPAATQARFLTVASNQETSAGYAVYLRHLYIADAKKIYRANRWTGVGIGNFGTAGREMGLSGISDPHMVLLLQAAEGGVALVAGFLLLIGWTFLRLWRLRKTQLAPLAAGVLVATFVHGLLDVYWVRGTPVLGWLLVGMACAAATQREPADQADR